MLTIEQIKTLINGLRQPVLNMAGRLIVAEETARQALDRSKQALSNMSAKMEKVNPVGEGSFSLGRNPSSSIGVASFAVGASVEASGAVSHAEGASSTASGYATHAEGNFTQASGDYSHAEGNFTQAPGMFAHAEGFSTQAQGMASHAEGRYTRAEHGCHAEGAFTEAIGQYCHAEGYSNIPLEGFLHIVGNGSDEGNRRSNAHTLDWKGNAWYQGDVLVGSTSGTDRDEGSVRLAKITEVIPAPVTAEVGQTVRVSAVDENGVPTAWEAVDLPAPPRMPSAPQFDITTTELARYIWLDTLNGLPLESYGYTEMRVSVANVPQETMTVSEFQVWYNAEAANRNENPHISANTDFISGATQRYWGGYINIRNGNIWGMRSALTNPRWRTEIVSNADPVRTFEDEVIKTINLKSVLADIPVGTNIKIWLA